MRYSPHEVVLDLRRGTVYWIAQSGSARVSENDCGDTDTMSVGGLLTTLGCLLLVGLALDAVGRRTRLPRITLLVLFGMTLGSSGFDLLPVDPDGWYETLADLALTMIAFLLGGELSKSTLKRHGRAILAVSLSITLVSALVIAGGLFALGVPLDLALLLAGIGLATAPAATHDVIQEAGAEGPVTRTLLGVVAIDDAWGIIVFSILLGLVAVTPGVSPAAGVLDGLIDVFGALLLGTLIGLPAAYATGRIRPGKPTLTEALGVVLLSAGLSLWFDVSYLLTGMTAGVWIVNLARHHDYPFHEIEHISWPLLILFFVLAGAAIDLKAVLAGGTLTLCFISLRFASRLLGGWIGGRLGGLSRKEAALIGVALTPQAGIALGMALVAVKALPEVAGLLVIVTVGSTVFFELIGPILTRFVLVRLGEAGSGERMPET